MLLQGTKTQTDVPTAALGMWKRSQAWNRCGSSQQWKVRAGKLRYKIMVTLQILEPRGPNVVTLGMKTKAQTMGWLIHGPVPRGVTCRKTTVLAQ